MKTYSSQTLDALDAGAVITVGAVKIETEAGFRVWGGDGLLDLDGETYIGIGDRGLVQATASQLGGSEQSLELILSGVNSDVVPIIQAARIRNAPATVWRLLFNASGSTLLAAHKFRRGRVDALPIEDTPGGLAKITARIEGAARGLGRQTGRLRSDADQRMVDASDGAFQWVTQAPLRSLAWGGKPPARISSGVLPGAVTTPGGTYSPNWQDFIS